MSEGYLYVFSRALGVFLAYYLQKNSDLGQLLGS